MIEGFKSCPFCGEDIGEREVVVCEKWMGYGPKENTPKVYTLCHKCKVESHLIDDSAFSLTRGITIFADSEEELIRLWNQRGTED